MLNLHEVFSWALVICDLTLNIAQGKTPVKQPDDVILMSGVKKICSVKSWSEGCVSAFLFKPPHKDRWWRITEQYTSPAVPLFVHP